MTTALIVLAIAVGLIPAAAVLVFLGMAMFTLADLFRCPPLGLAGFVIGSPGALVLFLVALAMGETS